MESPVCVLISATPIDNQGLFNFRRLDYFGNDVIEVFDTNKCSVLSLAVLVLVLEPRHLIVITEAIEVVGEGLV